MEQSSISGKYFNGRTKKPNRKKTQIQTDKI